MSFSHEVKQEILENKPLRSRCKKARAYGLFLFGRSFSPQEISLHTELPETAELFCRFARDLLGDTVSIAQGERRRSAKTLYTVRLAAQADRERLLNAFAHGEGINEALLPSPEHVQSFLSGAYLACGNVTDPAKSYHLEFVTKHRVLAEGLLQLLESAIPGARQTQRRQSHVVYYKECGPIEDLLTLMGATKSSLAVIDVEMIKSVRNRANRATNCETANIDKTVAAASEQIEDIRLVLRTNGEEGLPEPLLHVARLRLEYPELSLRELAELSEEPLSRSGIYHRLDKLSRLAADIRREQGE